MVLMSQMNMLEAYLRMSQNNWFIKIELITPLSLIYNVSYNCKWKPYHWKSYKKFWKD